MDEEALLASDASEILGMSERSFRRYRQRYEGESEAGTAFVETETDYDALLAHTGWRLVSRSDLTLAFANSMRRLIDAREAHERRLIERALFVAEPV